MRGTDFAELRAFAEVARRRSFARAAEHLRIAPSTLSQTVRALEERLGVTLLVRTTRSVALSSAGTRLLERFAPALEEIEAAVAEAHDGRATPSGPVRIHALRPAYLTQIEPRLGRIRELLPEVVLDLYVDDAPRDVAADGFDFVVRRAEFVDSGMTALELGADLRHAAVASPAYLAAHGEPATPDDLAGHRCIRWRPAGGDTQPWRFKAAGVPVSVAVDGPLIVSHCDAAVAAALQGVGIAYVLQSYSLPFTTTGRLRPLLTGYLPHFGGWRLCHSRHARLTAAARGVAGVLVGSLQSGQPPGG